MEIGSQHDQLLTRQGQRHSPLAAALLDGAPAAVLATDSASRIIYWNKRADELLCLSQLEARGCDLAKLLAASPKEEAKLRSILETALASAPPAHPLAIRAGLGDLRSVRLAIQPLRDETGEVQALVAVGDEATEQDQLWEELHHLQRLNAVGNMVAGIAHNLANLLTIIVGRGQLLSLALPEGNPSRRHLDDMLKAVDMALALTQQLLVFARPHAAKLGPVDVNSAVTAATGLLQASIRGTEGINVLLRLQPDLSPARADPVLLQQIVINLAFNSREAMPDGGKLTVGTRDVTLSKGKAGQLTPPRPPGHYVMLAVKDTGTGMSPETRQHAFDGFYTTKQGHAGLGLPTVKRMVAELGGAVMVESEIGQGTTVKVLLPRSEGLLQTQEPHGMSRTGVPGADGACP